LTCDFWAEFEEKNNGSGKGNEISRFAFGFAPAFGRAVSPFGARLGAEVRLYLNGNGKDGAGGRFASHPSR
jgi:hypothetical protein